MKPYRDPNMGAPIGNQNSSKSNRLWGETIKRAVLQSDGAQLRKIAEALLKKAEEGDVPAIKELGDRLDGKVAQPIGGTDDLPPINHSLEVSFVGNKG